jgi:hypothetical protein
LRAEEPPVAQAHFTKGLRLLLLLERVRPAMTAVVPLHVCLCSTVSDAEQSHVSQRDGLVPCFLWKCMQPARPGVRCKLLQASDARRVRILPDLFQLFPGIFLCNLKYIHITVAGMRSITKRGLKLNPARCDSRFARACMHACWPQAVGLTYSKPSQLTTQRCSGQGHGRTQSVVFATAMSKRGDAISCPKKRCTSVSVKSTSAPPLYINILTTGIQYFVHRTSAAEASVFTERPSQQMQRKSYLTLYSRLAAVCPY